MPLARVIGHQQIVPLLAQAVARRRVPQSLIFAGPEGVGKFTTALALAQAINCPQQRNDDACGTCVVCRRIDRRSFSDVIVLDKGEDASIKIDALRARVLDAVGYRPFEGARRVFIIDGAEDMTGQAQDALLKTLEEPPPAAILILVSAYPDTLLATIRSRCRRLRFGPLGEQDVARVLVDRAGMDAASAARRAAASAGSVSRALAMEEGEFLGDRDAALGVLRAAARGNTGERIKAAGAFAKHAAKRRAREAASSRLAILSSIVRDLGTLSAGGPVPLANADLAGDLARLVPAYPTTRVATVFAAIEAAESALERNASPKIVADWLAVSV